MPNSSDGSAAAPAPQTDEFVSRKLIRPSLAPQSRGNHQDWASSDRNVPRSPRPSTDQTHAETFYYQKQIQSRTPLTVALKNGEMAEGILEWYDRDSVRLIRRDQSNLLIYKASIKYMYKTAESKK